MILRLASAALVACLALAAPAGAHKDKAPVPDMTYAPVAPVTPPPPPADGAIFHAAYGYAPLTAGARATAVGDVITILLAEKTQAVKTNSASTDRSGNIAIQPPPTGPLSFIKGTNTQVGAGGSFTGKGAASQSNQLDGQVSVTVAQVLPNGNLLVRGQKVLTLNRGEEQIRIQGIVRPADILPGNTVLSYQVADARITYSGTGEIARASRQGWLGRLFSIVSPF